MRIVIGKKGEFHEHSPFEKEMATYPSILAREIPWTEEPRGYSLWGHKRVGQDLAAKREQ